MVLLQVESASSDKPWMATISMLASESEAAGGGTVLSLHGIFELATDDARPGVLEGLVGLCKSGLKLELNLFRSENQTLLIEISSLTVEAIIVSPRGSLAQQAIKLQVISKS